MTTIFVGGAMRTGTTVLQAVLCSSAESNPVIDEAQYLTRLAYLYHFGKETFDRYQRPYFADRDEFKDFHARMLGDLLSRTLERHAPAKHLVLKNPEMTPLFPDIAELVPDAKFVATVRDPRDTVAAILDVLDRQAAQGAQGAAGDLNAFRGDVQKVARHALSYYGPILTHPDEAFRKRVLVVRYEDLVRDPAAMAGQLAAFTGLPIAGFDAAQPWRSAVDFADAERAKEPYHSALRGQPLTAARIGRHKERLTAADVAVVDDVWAGLMNMFQYAPAG